MVKLGRTFLSRMYETTAKVKKLSYYTRLTKEFRSDLLWWHMFITRWNGTCFFHTFLNEGSRDYQIQTDASGTWSCGAYFNGQWFQLPWSPEWGPINIMAKELVPIVLSCAVWGSVISKSTVEFRCDNRSLVDAISKGSSRESMVMHLLRCLWFFTAMHDTHITVSHIPGAPNTSADLLSRNQQERFCLLHPQASHLPTTIPPSLISLISPSQPDWTSSSFQHNFCQLLPMNSK